MADTVQTAHNKRAPRHSGDRHAPHLSITALGMSLAIFLSVTYLICVSFGLLFPNQQMYGAWSPLLPGFTWLSWPSFFLGLVESFAYGWYIALVFGPLFNFFSSRWQQ